MIRAIGMLELTSISRGIFTADQMIKMTNVEVITANSVCPGKYIIILHGDVSSVENAVSHGEEIAEEFLVDSILIPNVEQKIFPAITGTSMPENIGALGIMESYSQADLLYSADQILKVADLEPIELRLGNGIGGKAYFAFTGDIAAVNAGVDLGKTLSKDKGFLVNVEVIASLSKELIPSLL